MNESVKTVVFVAVAAVVVGAAWVGSSRSIATPEVAEVGKPLFTGVNDPSAVTSLEIRKFDDSTSRLDSLKIEQTKGGAWKIPSHGDYPADAKEKVAKAASAVMDVKIVGVASDRSAQSGDHDRFGVVDPDPKNAMEGTLGLGTRVILRDDKGELADFIIGKPVEGGASDLRYVRRTDGDRVYTARIDTANLSTKFDSWIETDALKLSSTIDIRKLSFDDYSAMLTAQGVAFNDRARMSIHYDEQKATWVPDALLEFNSEKEDWVAAPLKPDEELNQTAINDLKNALNDLKIVDVELKPAVLARSLAEGSGHIRLQQQQEVRSLASKGFYPAPIKGDEGFFDIKSSEGEVLVTMKNGVEYVLRFGNAAGLASSDGENTEAKQGEKKEGEKKEGDKKEEKPADKGSLNRYLFVLARLNEKAVEPPKLEPLPEAKKTETKPESAPEDKKPGANEPEDKKPEVNKPADKPAGDAKPESKPAASKPEDKKPEAAKPDDKKPEAAKPEEKPAEKKEGGGGADEPTEAKAADKKPEEKNPDDKKPETKPEEKKPAEKTDAKTEDKKPEEKKPEAKTEDSKPETKPAETKPAAKELDEKALQAERERIEKANAEKLKKYQDELTAAKRKVRELNYRFANYYYTVPEDSYKKIRLSRKDLVKKKEAPKTEGKEGDLSIPQLNVEDLKPESKPQTKPEAGKPDASKPEGKPEGAKPKAGKPDEKPAAGKTAKPKGEKPAEPAKK